MKNFFAYVFIICYLLFGSLFHAPPDLLAQTAAELEAVLAAETMSYEQAASFVLQAAEITSAGSAYNYAREHKWLSAKTAPDNTAVLNEVSLLIMSAFGIKGGIMYSSLKSPRYAYRELVHQGIIQGRADPEMTVSGDLLLFMIGRVLDLTEGEI
jgi:hypothetical protein